MPATSPRCGISCSPTAPPSSRTIPAFRSANYDPKKWRFFPFGRYAGPINVFPGRYQAKYAELFRRSQPLGFGIGYRWRSYESNLLLSVRLAAGETANVEATSAAPVAEPVRHKTAARATASERGRSSSREAFSGLLRDSCVVLRRVDPAPASEPPRHIPSRARRSCQRHVVYTRGAPGLAAQQPRQRHPSAAPQAETPDRLVAIDRTGRQMAAVVSRPAATACAGKSRSRHAPGIARQALHRARRSRGRPCMRR